MQNCMAEDILTKLSTNRQPSSKMNIRRWVESVLVKLQLKGHVHEISKIS